MCEVVEMSGWSGFSEEEVRRLQQKDSAGPAITARGRRPGPASSRSRQQLQRERALQAAAQRSGAAGNQALSPGQLLTAPPLKEEPSPAAAPPVAPGSLKVDVQVEKPGKGDPEPTAEEKKKLEVKELEKQEVELREKTRLELLQHEQKLIEERNRRKKALLTKTIAEKSKQTQAEAVKLKRIQKELQALDDSVSNDISILRGKIEQASWDYNTARKRYDKAEAEYVTAKMDLHKKTELKEQLAEHLCAIIQQNELRKAHKLEELMQQLQLQATEEELERQREEEKKQQQQEEEEERQKEEEKKQQKKEEEERRNCSEGQTNGKGGSEESEEVQSTKDSNIIKEEKGGGDGPVSIVLPKSEKDRENVEMCEQKEAEAS